MAIWLTKLIGTFYVSSFWQCGNPSTQYPGSLLAWDSQRKAALQTRASQSEPQKVEFVEFIGK